MVKRWLRGIGLAVFSLVFLAGCSGPLGTALMGLAGAGAMYAGQAAVDRGKENVEDRILHRAKRREYVSEITSGLLAEAKDLRDKKDFKGHRRVMACLLKFHDTQYVDLLVIQAGKRLSGEATELPACFG